MPKDEPDDEPEKTYSHADLAAVEEAVEEAIAKLTLGDDTELELVSVDEDRDGRIVITLDAAEDEDEPE